MKYFLHILLISLLATSCYSQKNKRLLRSELISDFTETPIFSKLTEEGSTSWKEEYNYMDNIDIYAITYLSDGLKVNGFMVMPKEKGTYPAIIFNRGGNRDFGALTVGTAAIVMGRLANEGYVVIASQYRGNGGSDGKEEFGGADVNDIITLTDVLKEIPEADAEKIGIFGWSRGGMMTYIALAKSDKFKAAVVGGAVSNMKKLIEDRPEMESGVLAELVPDYENNKALELDKRSAVVFAKQLPKDVPILIMHGSSDWRVLPSQSLEMASTLEEQEIPYRLVIFEGADHGISEHRDEVNEQIISWFDRFLKNNEELPDASKHGK